MVPDSITLERARVLETNRKWHFLAHNEEILWGECKGSGNQSYLTAAKIDTSAYYCNCIDDKTPCRHIIALWLLHLSKPTIFLSNSTYPSWINSWKEKGYPTKSTADKEIQKLDQQTVAKIKRSEKRMLLMEKGVVELENWLIDLVEQGLAVAEKHPASFWDSFAARMVDAKLGSIGRRIRLFKSLFLLNNWPQVLLGELGDMYLFVQAFKKIELLPDTLQQEILTVAGVALKKDEVLESKGINDHWLVVGQTSGIEENLRFRRSWLRGEKSQKDALILDFAWGNNPFPVDWKVGMSLIGEVVFYPGAFPSRALIKKFTWSDKSFDGLLAHVDLHSFSEQYAKAVAANPWIRSFPALLDLVTPYYEDNRFILVDQAKKFIPLQPVENVGWKIMAISSGQPVQLFGEWDGAHFFPLSIVKENRLISLG